jgi:GWxTD domain-containing protein
LYAYCEVYNIPLSDSVNVTYEVFGVEKKSIQKSNYWLKSKGRVTQNFVEIQGENLPHGTYRAKFTINSLGKRVSVERPFKWYWSGIPVSLTDINDAIDKLRYIASKKELKRLKKAKDDDKQQEFIKFWKVHDPTPGTHENELMEEYYRRIQFANENFSGFKDGWETDMGMVYVKLGPPDVVERNPFNQDFAYVPGRTVKSLEVWVYYEYNRQFIFVDENGFGEYRLANPQSFYDIINRY